MLKTYLCGQLDAGEFVSKLDGIYIPLSMEWGVAIGILGNQKVYLTSAPLH